MTDYTTRDYRRIRDVDTETWDFMVASAEKVSAAHGDKFTWTNFRIDRYLQGGRLVVCHRRGVPVGFMLSRLSHSIFDHTVKLWIQDLLYAKPGTRAAYHLMQDFIDFGKTRADHIITMIGSETNIKGSSLEKLGFDEVETYYRMET